jgi:hypothetical protein
MEAVGPGQPGFRELPEVPPTSTSQPQAHKKTPEIFSRSFVNITNPTLFRQVDGWTRMRISEAARESLTSPASKTGNPSDGVSAADSRGGKRKVMRGCVIERRREGIFADPEGQFRHADQNSAKKKAKRSAGGGGGERRTQSRGGGGRTTKTRERGVCACSQPRTVSYLIRRRRPAESTVLPAAGGRAGAGTAAVVERRSRAAPAPPLLPGGRTGRRRGAARALSSGHRRPDQLALRVRSWRWRRLAPRRRPSGEVSATQRADDVGGQRFRVGCRHGFQASASSSS